MWVSTKFQCTTMSVDFDRKRKKNQRPERSFYHSLNRFIEPFDCIPRDLLIDKLGVFDFHKK